MKIRRLYLLALLLLLFPLLQGLVVVFSNQPIASDERAYCEQETVEVLQGFLEIEEQVEEDEVCSSFLFSGLTQSIVSPLFYDRCGSLSASAQASILAAGWRMPLRI
jgi:hypothetical protein